MSLETKHCASILFLVGAVFSTVANAAVVVVAADAMVVRNISQSNGLLRRQSTLCYYVLPAVEERERWFAIVLRPKVFI